MNTWYLWFFKDESGGIDQCLIVTKGNGRSDREWCYETAAKQMGVSDVACMGCVELPSETVNKFHELRLDYAYVG